MERIILIETSTALCSVALAADGKIAAYRESSAPKAHASLIAVFIKEVLDECGITLDDCDAVCVSMGPGSYTGLRVGVSTAKGICFGSRKPLIAVGTLDTLVAQAVNREIATPLSGARNDGRQTGNDKGSEGHSNDGRQTGNDKGSEDDNDKGSEDHNDKEGRPGVIARSEATWQSPRYIIPMIDARRMEVYTAVFEIATPLSGARNDGQQTGNDKGSEDHNNDKHSEGYNNDKGSEDHNNDGQQTGNDKGSEGYNDKEGWPGVIARSEATWQSPRYVQLTETAPKIIDENSFADILEQGPCLFIGDGAGKCEDVIKHPNAHFCQCHPDAASMLAPALKAYKEKRFEDVAYFEPFYLKEFTATVSKKKLW